MFHGSNKSMWTETEGRCFMYQSSGAELRIYATEVKQWAVHTMMGRQWMNEK
jgi:hypothetical protein